jgi:hypothetical protein
MHNACILEKVLQPTSYPHIPPISYIYVVVPTYDRKIHFSESDEHEGLLQYLRSIDVNARRSTNIVIAGKV